jgi:hypothetical protein
MTGEVSPSGNTERETSELDRPLASPYLIVVAFEALVIVLLWALARAYS